MQTSEDEDCEIMYGDVKSLRIKKLIYLLAGAMAAAFLVLSCLSHYQTIELNQDVFPLNSGWTCRYDDVEEKVALPFQLRVAPDTVVSYSNMLPEWLGSDAGLRFRTRMQKAEVLVDGKEIYSYPEEELLGGAIPSTWHFVRLPDGSGGKTVEIRLESPYRIFSGGMQQVLAGNFNDLFYRTKAGQIGVFRMGILLGMIGMAMILLSMLFRKYYSMGYQKALGILLIDAAVWLCGEARMPLLMFGLEAKYYITMSALLLCPVFLLGYLCLRWSREGGLVLRCFIYASMVFAGVCIALNIMEIVKFPEMFPAIHLVLAAAAACAVWIHVKAMCAGTIRSSEMICVAVILAAALLEMVLFYTGRYTQVGMFVRIAILIYAANFLRLCVAAIIRKLRQNIELARELRMSRLELMNSQIQPHFIYNTLNSIRALIRLNPDAAYDAVYDFSTYLRANLNSLKDDDLIPFRDELRNVTAYLNIEKLRLGKRLNTQFQIEEKDFLVPHLCIQPLVENAVKHGIWRKKEPGTVWITEYETESFHVIEITDDGTGFDTTMLETDSDKASEHIGIRNIRFRIEWLTGGTIDIRSEKGKGTRAVVRIPQNEIGRRRKERMKKDESDRG